MLPLVRTYSDDNLLDASAVRAEVDLFREDLIAVQQGIRQFQGVPLRHAVSGKREGRSTWKTLKHLHYKKYIMQCKPQ